MAMQKNMQIPAVAGRDVGDAFVAAALSRIFSRKAAVWRLLASGGGTWDFRGTGKRKSRWRFEREVDFGLNMNSTPNLFPERAHPLGQVGANGTSRGLIVDLLINGC